MGILEIVIVSLLGLLLASTGWLVRISQILVGVLMKSGRSLLANILEDQIKQEDTIKQPDTKKKSKRT